VKTPQTLGLGRFGWGGIVLVCSFDQTIDFANESGIFGNWICGYHVLDLWVIQLAMKNEPISAFAYISFRLVVVALVFSLIVSACSKSGGGSNNPVPAGATSLVVSVIDSTGRASANAIVTLYRSDKDISQETNPIASKTTGTDGKVTFNSLNPIEYFFRANNGPENNYRSTTKTPSAIIKGQANTISTTVRHPRTDCNLYQSSWITIYNISPDPYDLEINGAVVRRMASNSNVFYMLGAGTHSFRAIQVSGYVLTPTVRSLTTNLAACQPNTWEIR
jgi:hypothetical protein